MRSVCLAFALAGCAATPKVPDALPETLLFELPDLEGKKVSSADYAGKVVLVDLWATWCTPCLASFPFYAELERKYGPKGFAVLAVSVDTEDSAVTSFLDGRDIPFRILRDPEGTLPERLRIETMPTAYLIAADGRVLHEHGGYVSSDGPKIEKWINDALSAQR